MKQNHHRPEWKEVFQQAPVPDQKDAIMDQLRFIEPDEAPETEKGRQRRRRGLYPGLCAAVCAACAVMLVFAFLPSLHPASAVVSFDVNPSIELSLDAEENVTEVLVHNEEGELVLDDMELEGVDIDVAVNALIGSMMRHGYLDELKNTLLVTVKSEDEQMRSRLRKSIVNDIEEMMEGNSLQISILSQDMDTTNEYTEIAQKYGISEGKAALISELVQSDPAYQFEDFVGLSITDLDTLIQYKNLEYTSITSNQVVNHSGYLTSDEAKDVVFGHAGVDQDEISAYTYTLDCDDNRLVYYIQFQDPYAGYQYEINAISGEIIDFSVTLK